MQKRSFVTEFGANLSFTFTWRETPKLDLIHLTPHPMYNWSKRHAKHSFVTEFCANLNFTFTLKKETRKLDLIHLTPHPMYNW